MRFGSRDTSDDALPSGGWMLTLSDLLTLLLAFFVLQFSLMKQAKTTEAAELIERQVMAQDDSASSTVEEPLIEVLSDALAIPSAARQEAGSGETIQLQMQGKNVVLSLPNAAFLGKGAELSLTATEHVRALARTISGRELTARIVVETDSSPPDSEFTSNWELTQAQAIVILRQMIDAGLSPIQISAVAYSDSRSVPEDPSSSFGHLNRHVEIVISPAGVS